MNYFTTLEELKTYRDTEALSQSYLKLVLSNNVNKKFKETIPMLIGSYMDSLLTSPELTDDLFQVGLAKRPSDAIKGFLDDVFILGKETCESDLMSSNLEDWKTPILSLVREKGYQPKWGDDAVWKSILTDGQAYWEELISSQGKMLITQEEFENCTNIAQLSCSSSLTGKYFLEQENIDKYYQKPLYWTYEGLSCKGLLDILIFEEETKTIYVIDIKSTGVSSLREWFNVCRQKNYPFQMSFYKLGVEQNYSELLKDGWKIQCRWIVIPTGFFKPWVVPCTSYMLNIAKRGYFEFGKTYWPDDNHHIKDEIKASKYIPGFDEAIRRYKIKEEQGLLDYDIEYFETQGKLNDSQSIQYYFQ